MDIEDVTGILRAVVVELEGRLPSIDIENAWSLIEAGEPGVALENLCTQIYEYDVPVPQHVQSQIVSAGETMKLDPDLSGDLEIAP